MAEDTQYRNLDRGRQAKQGKSFTLESIGLVFDVLLLLVAALFFSVVLEWIGMYFFWTEEGVMHSERMLTTELGYINRDFHAVVLGSTPMEFAIESARSIDYWLFEWTRFRDVLAWGMTPTDDANKARRLFADVLLTANDYIAAAINITQLFGVRLAIALLSMPAFLLIGIAALIDGLAHRDLRRFGGASESSFIYHKAKPWVKPAFVGAWFIYLSVPFAMHPNMIFVPASALFGLMIFITSAMFKKTL